MPKKKKLKLKLPRRKKLKLLAVVVFEPNTKFPEHYKNSPVRIGEQVLFMGLIPNVPGHCAVAKSSGELVWLMHPEDFRMATDDEL